MARFQPRSNVYTVMPILATLIMAAGITFTWLRINEYKKPPKPTAVPDLREYPDFEEPKAVEEVGGIEEGVKEEGAEEGAKAPGFEEEPGEDVKAPEKEPEDLKAPPDKEEGPAEPGKEPAPKKAEEEEKE